MKNENWEIKKKVGQRIKDSRKSSGYTQTQVAKIMMMTQQQYSRFENGIFELSYGQLVTLCQLFDVSSDYILGLKEY